MEYDFHRDLMGNCEAKLSMGHEAFASWINDHLRTPQACQSFLALIAATKSEYRDRTLNQGDFSLSLSPTEIQIEAHNLSQEQEFEEDLNYYDNEQTAHCGLEDFESLLEAWTDFISR